MRFWSKTKTKKANKGSLLNSQVLSEVLESLLKSLQMYIHDHVAITHLCN